MNKLSGKTDAILKENYVSVVYAREMTERLRTIEQEVITAFLQNRNADTSLIGKELLYFENSIVSEKNNITEAGEGNLVNEIENGYTTFKDSVLDFIQTGHKVQLYNLLQKSDELSKLLARLSDINGKAIEIKTDTAKAYSRRALAQMSIIAAICFLTGMSFTFSFSSYFNQRFSELYFGIREMVSSNYDHQLVYYGNDEFQELSQLINEMAAKLKGNKQKMSVTLTDDHTKDLTMKDIDDLRQMLFRMKTIEENAVSLISRFEKK